ncbi:TPA: morphogenetic protein [Proteus mirabilis]|uniref:Morphogenetic protein n=2 Tax=Morganellaceae TaxID=1903414 RepID=A0AAI9MTW3_MORMO|nr:MULTISPECIES: morphogenetic protein [Providencia]EJV1664330.1 morphogenetic protein [Klebsiella pneumoniae]EKW8762784.1 morphogenetic protein [Morganella morganii]THB20510.1 morphogenetic protein [Providencia sp. MGF014]HEJ9424971.1 morphogenetic protein [Proteus mirabilis]ELI9034675.1 morphogenetic protein [Morganella morganii]
MKLFPINFTDEQVRAIRSGQKVQTRQLIKEICLDTFPESLTKRQRALVDKVLPPKFGPTFFCRFGHVGDRLWIRETYGDCGVRLVYRADLEDGAANKVKRWFPAQQMTQFESRITLEITEVRIERLRDISDADALREGCSIRDTRSGDCLADVFGRKWSVIHGVDSWKANPMVWVIDFKIVDDAR